MCLARSGYQNRAQEGLVEACQRSLPSWRAGSRLGDVCLRLANRIRHSPPGTIGQLVVDGLGCDDKAPLRECALAAPCRRGRVQLRLGALHRLLVIGVLPTYQRAWRGSLRRRRHRGWRVPLDNLVQAAMPTSSSYPPQGAGRIRWRPPACFRRTETRVDDRAPADCLPESGKSRVEESLGLGQRKHLPDQT